MARRYDTVSFLSDYGTADEFAGVVRSVVRSIAPHAQVIDLTHEVPAHDIRAGSLTLVRAIQYVADGVVLAVVDPGVGTSRRAVAVEVSGGDGILVGPDNGLLAPAVAMTGGAGRAVVLTSTDHQLPAPGPTFAGRDVFGPAAAHLCNGVDMAELGPEIDPITLLPGMVPLPNVEEGRVQAEVLWVDHFGNIQLNIGPDEIDGLGTPVRVTWGLDKVRMAGRVSSFAELSPGQLGLLVDSYGLMALTFDRSSASA
ncbi:MAG: SAM hydrolase/SAM-dependent halogenase family protein, partial [Acidimicrobiales bacterium]